MRSRRGHLSQKISLSYPRINLPHALSKLPRSEFSRTTLKNVSSQSFHSCTKCEQRRNALQRQVCDTMIKCDCLGGVHQAAREKCPIFHQKLSHRWPGKDCDPRRNPFTWDDVQFLNRLPTVPRYSWWHKLWGARVR